MHPANRFHPTARDTFVADSSKGFSAVELLVSIIIVSILAALLFPVFTSVKSQSSSTRCLAHLRQLGAAFVQYTVETGKLPYVQIGPTYWFEGNSAPASFFAGPYLHAAPRDPRRGPSESPIGGMFYCPSAGDKGIWAPPEWKGFDYAYNITLAGASPRSFADPARTILVTEGGNYCRIKAKSSGSPEYSPGSIGLNPGGTQWDTTSSTGETIIKYAHKGYANFLFMDGHVKAQQQQDLNEAQFTGRF